MAHNKNRSIVAVGDVDWSKPQLSELLDKVGDWAIDKRSRLPPQAVQIRIASGWDTSVTAKSALLMAEIDGALVLATPFPLPHGSEVQVIGLPGAGSTTRWAVVTDEREGCRAEDIGHGVFMSWLHPR